jgi:predicted RNase H-like nuclease (RuvC/YqgF family)
VIKCEIRGLEWVHPQDLHKHEEHRTDEQRIQLLEKHIAWYQQRIDSIQKIANRIRSERIEHVDDFEIISNCEGIKVDHVSEQRRVARWVSTGTAFYYDEDKRGGRRIENETLEMFKKYCSERYGVQFEGNGYSAQDKDEIDG